MVAEQRNRDLLAGLALPARAAALQRARERIRQQRGGDLDRRLRALLEAVRGDRGYLRRLVVPTGQRSVFIRTEQIDWIEAERNYMRLHVGGRNLHAIMGKES